VSFDKDDSSTIELQNGESSTVELSSLGSLAQPLSYGENGNGHEPDWFKVDLRRKQREIACRQMRINPPALTRLIANDNIDPIYIFAHCWQVEKQGHTLGLAIHRIERMFSPSKEAMHWAEAQMKWDTGIKCQHCHRRFSVVLDLGEEKADAEFDCPHCGQVTGDAETLIANNNGHQPEEEQPE